MKRPRGALTPLGLYLFTNRISSKEFAEMMGKQLGIKDFSPRTIEKWRTVSKSVPTGKNMRAIKALTGITADQMVEAA